MTYVYKTFVYEITKTDKGFVVSNGFTEFTIPLSMDAKHFIELNHDNLILAG